MADNAFDVIVIGAGPGGYVAAIRAAQLGLKVACVEAQKLGGVCNNWGCIPTKAMLEAANYARHTAHMADFGVTVGDVKLDIGVASKRARGVADQGAKGTAFLFKKNKIQHFQGWGRIAGKGKVEVDPGKNAGHGDEPAGKGEKTVLTARHIIIATGSRPRSLPILKIDGDRVWSSDHAVFPAQMPKSIGIIGAGAIGMEFADVYNAFGAKVTIVEAMERILPVEDADSSKLLARSYAKRGIEVLESAKLEKAEVGKSGVKLTLRKKDGSAQELEVERVLVAVGRAPITDDIGLDKVGLKTDDRGFIETNEKMQTKVEGVYAIGDVTKPPLLAHKASHEGIVAAEAIAGKFHGGVDYNNIPGVTYCHPEVASVGMTEEQAKKAGLDFEVGTFPFSANGRARTAGETEGFIKIIRDKKYSEILGAHMVGPHVSEMISEFIVGRHLETTVEEMEKAMHPHPTLSEAIAEAALASLGRVIHM